MKRIVIRTKTGFALYGDSYEVNIQNNTKQDYSEFEKAMLKYRVNLNSMERWYVEEKTLR